MFGSVKGMMIDEEGKHKPTNYAKTIKKTDHNTIILEVDLEKSKKEKLKPFINTNNEEQRERFRMAMTESDISKLFSDVSCNIDEEFSLMHKIWNSVVDSSFKKIMPKRNNKSGISKSVRELMQKEKWIRENVLENPERGRQIAEITNEIKQEIERNRAVKIEERVEAIQSAKNPSAEIFKVRKMKKRVENVGFPLKDDKGI